MIVDSDIVYWSRALSTSSAENKSSAGPYGLSLSPNIAIVTAAFPVDRLEGLGMVAFLVPDKRISYAVTHDSHVPCQGQSFMNAGSCRKFQVYLVCRSTMCNDAVKSNLTDKHVVSKYQHSKMAEEPVLELRTPGLGSLSPLLLK